MATTWTISATLSVGTTSDAGLGGAAVEGGVNEGPDTGEEHVGGDGVILRRFGALSLSPSMVSSSLPCLSSRGLFAVVSTTTGGAAARSSPLAIGGVDTGGGGGGGGGTDVDEDGKGGGSERGGGACRG